MPSGRNRVTEMSDETKAVHNVAPLELYVVEYSDGSGQKSTRIMGRVGKSNKFYFPFPEGTERAIKHAANWLNDGVSRFLGGRGDALPDAENVAKPMGNPLEDGDGV